MSYIAKQFFFFLRWLEKVSFVYIINNENLNLPLAKFNQQCVLVKELHWKSNKHPKIASDFKRVLISIC